VANLARSANLPKGLYIFVYFLLRKRKKNNFLQHVLAASETGGNRPLATGRFLRTPHFNLLTVVAPLSAVQLDQGRGLLLLLLLLAPIALRGGEMRR